MKFLIKLSFKYLFTGITIALVCTTICFSKDNNIQFISSYKCNDPQMISWVHKAHQEIYERKYLTLATVDENASPWNAPVYTAFDKIYHFYWMSATSSQHSKNIRLNGKVFAVIYNSTALEGTGFGVYLMGDSHELQLNDVNKIIHGISVMAARIHRNDLPSALEYLPPYPRRVYEFTPKRIWINTVQKIKGHTFDQRVEITSCFFRNS